MKRRATPGIGASYRWIPPAAIATLFALAPARAAEDEGPLARVREALSAGRDILSCAAILSEASVEMGGQEVGTVRTIASRNPRALLEVSEVSGVRQVVTLLGNEAWLEDTNGSVRELGGDELAAARLGHALLFHTYLLGSDAEMEIEVEGPRITLRPRDGSEEGRLILGKGALPSAFERTTSGVPLSTTFFEWRAVDGVLWPFGSRQSTGDARFDMTFRTVRVEFPGTLPDGAIPRPAAGHGADFALSDPDSARAIPFDLATSLIIVPARVDGRSGRFLLDTGAGATVLDAALADSLGLARRGTMEARGAGGSETASFVDLQTLSLPGIVISGQTVVTLALDDVAAVLGTPVDGILGYDFLSRFAVEIDYPGKRLALFPSGTYAARAGAVRVPLRIETNVPRIDGLLDGRHAGSFVLDTGNAWPLLLHAPFVEEQGLAEGEADVSVSGVGGAEAMRRTRVQSLAFGEVVFHDISALLATSGTGAVALEESIGNVGGALFDESVLAFDYGAGALWIVTPESARSASDR